MFNTPFFITFITLSFVFFPTQILSTCLENQYELSNEQCKNCSESLKFCLSCNGPFKCIVCEEGYYKDEKSSTCESCPFGTYFNSETNKCESCNKGCDICNDFQTCLFCGLGFIYNINTNQCDCLPGYFYSNLSLKCEKCSPNCQKCNDYYECDICLPYYFKNQSNQLCEQCSANCRTCLSPFECLECNSTFVYLNNQTKQCDQCLPNCLQCDNSETCNYCLDYNIDFKEYPTKQCVTSKCPAQCTFGLGIYDGNYIFCDRFTMKCEKCSEDNSCLQCPLRQIYNYEKCSKCAPSYYLIPLTSKCSKCLENCEICNTIANCEKCYDTHVYNRNLQKCELCELYILNCQRCNNENTCTLCKSGYYLNYITKKCDPCSSDCKICPNNMSCGICDKYTILNNITRKCDKCAEITKFRYPYYSFTSQNCTTCLNSNEYMLPDNFCVNKQEIKPINPEIVIDSKNNTKVLFDCTRISNVYLVYSLGSDAEEFTYYELLNSVWHKEKFNEQQTLNWLKIKFVGETDLNGKGEYILNDIRNSGEPYSLKLFCVKDEAPMESFINFYSFYNGEKSLIINLEPTRELSENDHIQILNNLKNALNLTEANPIYHSTKNISEYVIIPDYSLLYLDPKLNSLTQYLSENLESSLLKLEITKNINNLGINNIRFESRITVINELSDFQNKFPELTISDSALAISLQYKSEGRIFFAYKELETISINVKKKITFEDFKIIYNQLNITNKTVNSFENITFLIDSLTPRKSYKIFYFAENNGIPPIRTPIYVQIITTNSKKEPATYQDPDDFSNYLPCKEDCIQCENSTYCLICDHGYIKDNFGKCHICDETNIFGCKKCPLTNICLECFEGFILENNSCQKCEFPCETCQESTSKCDSCVLGYFYDSEHQKCSNYNLNCNKNESFPYINLFYHECSACKGNNEIIINEYCHVIKLPLTPIIENNEFQRIVNYDCQTKSEVYIAYSLSTTAEDIEFERVLDLINEKSNFTLQEKNNWLNIEYSGKSDREGKGSHLIKNVKNSGENFSLKLFCLQNKISSSSVSYFKSKDNGSKSIFVSINSDRFLNTTEKLIMAKHFVHALDLRDNFVYIDETNSYLMNPTLRFLNSDLTINLNETLTFLIVQPNYSLNLQDPKLINLCKKIKENKKDIEESLSVYLFSKIRIIETKEFISTDQSAYFLYKYPEFYNITSNSFSVNFSLSSYSNIYFGYVEIEKPYIKNNFLINYDQFINNYIFLIKNKIIRKNILNVTYNVDNLTQNTYYQLFYYIENNGIPIIRSSVYTMIVKTNFIVKEIEIIESGDNSNLILIIVISSFLILGLISFFIIKKRKNKDLYSQIISETLNLEMGSKKELLLPKLVNEYNKKYPHLFIDYRNITIDWEKGKIEEGKYSTVVYGKWNNMEILLKEINFINELNENTINKFFLEASIWQNIHNENVEELIGITCNTEFETNKLFLIMDAFSSQTLQEFLILENNKWLSSYKFKLNLCLEIIKGISVLHENNLVHQDLNTNNIIIDEGNKLRINDIGLSLKTILNKEKPYYLAPEIFNNGFFDKSTDIYSFGIIMLEILSGQKAIILFPEFLSENLENLTMEKINNFNIIKKIPNNFSMDAIEVIKMCLSCIPEVRPKAEILRNTIEKMIKDI